MCVRCSCGVCEYSGRLDECCATQSTACYAYRVPLPAPFLYITGPSADYLACLRHRPTRMAALAGLVSSSRAYSELAGPLSPSSLVAAPLQVEYRAEAAREREYEYS